MSEHRRSTTATDPIFSIAAGWSQSWRSVLIGQPFQYDPLSGQIPGLPEANRHLHRDYREGWSL